MSLKPRWRGHGCGGRAKTILGNPAHLGALGLRWIMLEYVGAWILLAMIPMYVIIGNPLF